MLCLLGRIKISWIYKISVANKNGWAPLDVTLRGARVLTFPVSALVQGESVKPLHYLNLGGRTFPNLLESRE